MRRAALLACLVAWLAAAPAQAATGTTTLVLGGAADAGLRATGVTVAPLAPATRAGRTFTLSASARTANPARVRHRGGLRLRSRAGRTLGLAAPRVELGALPALTARVAGRRRTLASVRLGRGDVVDRAADSVRIAGARVVLTRGGGALLRKRLGLRGRPTGRIATLAVRAAPQPPAPLPGPPPGPSPSTEPIPAARPATAVDVASAQVTWHVRESFIRYIATGEGTSVHDGAVAGEPVLAEGSDVPLTYDFGFPFGAGWFDPVSGRAAVRFGGRVHFSFSGHGIALDAAAPELELDGAGSRAIMRINGRREVLVDLRLGEAVAQTVDGMTRTYVQVPGRIPAGTGDSVFAGFYLAGDPFGWFTLSFATSTR